MEIVVNVLWTHKMADFSVRIYKIHVSNLNHCISRILSSVRSKATNK